MWKTDKLRKIGKQTKQRLLSQFFNLNTGQIEKKVMPF